ncbi:MAG: IS1595 family transposase [Acidobacteria bacterium]|nr:IS1595 family transposase [Acidobacteriota bacterium]
MMDETRTAPGKAFREGLSIIEVFDMFPNDRAAEKWFEDIRWGETGRCCPRCGSVETSECKDRKPMPYRCRTCRKHFSVRIGTTMQSTKIGYRKWALATYLLVTGLKGTAAMKVHRELKMTQRSAWFLMHRIREGFFMAHPPKLTGTVEVDEMYVGGKQENRHAKDRKRYSASDAYGKKPVVAAVQRDGKVIAQPIHRTDANTLTRFVEGSVRHGSRVITDDHGGYTDLMESYRHRTVKHSVGQYVKGVDVHTNTVESLWSMFKRGFVGTYHRMSFKHLHRYVQEFAGRKNQRELDTYDQMVELVRGFDGRRLRYRDLVGRRAA